MKANVLSEEQCTWSLEGETFLCLLYCFKTWQFSNDKRMLQLAFILFMYNVDI